MLWFRSRRCAPSLQLPHRKPPPSHRSAAVDLPFGERDFSGAFAWLEVHAKERGAFEKARKVLGVSVNTLKARYASGNAGATKKGPAPRLGAEVESVIVDWVKLAHETGCSVPVEAMCNKAREIARKLGVDPKSVGGEDWRRLFFRRHPELSVRQSQLIGLERLLSLNPEAVQRYFDILAIASEGVAPGDKYIMDETNVELRDGGGKVRDDGGEKARLGACRAPSFLRTHSLPPPTFLSRRPFRSLRGGGHARCTSRKQMRCTTTSRCWCAGRRAARGSRPRSSGRACGRS
jgi:hypothetical protein